MEAPRIEELRRRILNHLYHTQHPVEAIHLWSGYLAALLECDLIDRGSYMALGSLMNEVRTDELYYLLADEPMPPWLRRWSERLDDARNEPCD